MKFPSDLLEALRAAQHIAVLTGAGASAESGVPTFRDAQTGLWAQFDPAALATPDAFRRNPKLVWEWYAWRRALVERAQPNPGHLALVEMERRVPQFTLITQNVDGLHQLAGSRNVIELHGSIRRYKCFACEAPYALSNEPSEAVPPRCPTCSGLIRPDVVWFGETLPARAYYAAIEAAQACDVFFSVGTSGLVEPAASLPRIARRALATLVTINLDVETESSPNAYAIHGKAGEVLPALVKAVWG
ncbi:MAG: NAD-dependent protein deacylase [Candidatus Roseilinea sp.]|nr:MAG: NAD-dependent protein deacylase [Candidatus Roseilinea sp.]